MHLANIHLPSTEIRKRIQKGETKQEVFDLFSNGKNEEMLRRILASIPDLRLKEKYLWLNNFLSFLVALALLMELIAALVEPQWTTFFSLAITGLIFYRMLQFDGFSYLAGAFWFILGIFNIIKERLTYQDDPHAVLFSSIVAGLFLLIATLMIFIHKKVFPYFHWFLPKKDAYGFSVFE